MSHHDAAMRLSDALDRVQNAVLRGDLPALETLSVEIDQVLQTLPRQNRTLAEALQRKADQNAVLLQAAGRGLRAAGRRLAEIRAARAGLTTYDGTGRRQDAPQAATGLSRRV